MEPHKHCQICGKPVPLDKDFCSEKCREDYSDLMKKKKRRMYIIYILLAVFLVLMFFQIG
ncbi:MAG: DUF2116 family Zn-ribbon domain-containing protein [Thermoplasmatota archaeon]